jgi:hypothetical protein
MASQDIMYAFEFMIEEEDLEVLSVQILELGHVYFSLGMHFLNS